MIRLYKYIVIFGLIIILIATNSDINFSMVSNNLRNNVNNNYKPRASVSSANVYKKEHNLRNNEHIPKIYKPEINSLNNSYKNNSNKRSILLRNEEYSKFYWNNKFTPQ